MEVQTKILMEYFRETRSRYVRDASECGSTWSAVCAQFMKKLNAEELTHSPVIVTGAISKKFNVDGYDNNK